MNEQERAERLSQEIDRLMRGERMSEGDPLLETANLLARAPIRPSLKAQARFQQQVNQWFRTDNPVPLRRPGPPSRGWALLGFASAVIVLVLAAFAFFLSHSQKQPMILTVTPSATSTLGSTPTQTPTTAPSPMPSASPTLSPTVTPTPVSRVIEGRITKIQSNTLIVKGVTILINGPIKRFCVGDLVKMTATLSPDTSWHADAPSVLIGFSACASDSSGTSSDLEDNGKDRSSGDTNDSGDGSQTPGQ